MVSFWTCVQYRGCCQSCQIKKNMSNLKSCLKHFRRSTEIKLPSYVQEPINFELMKDFLEKLGKIGPKMRQISIIFDGSDGQIHSTLEDISKYLINFDFLMVYAIFHINKHFFYNHVEKSRVLFFYKILSNKHAAPPIFDFLKQSVSCGIGGALLTFLRHLSKPPFQNF